MVQSKCDVCVLTNCLGKITCNAKEIVLTAFIYSFIIPIKAGNMFEFFKKGEYPKGGEEGCTPVNSW